MFTGRNEMINIRYIYNIQNICYICYICHTLSIYQILYIYYLSMIDTDVCFDIKMINKWKKIMCLMMSHYKALNEIILLDISKRFRDWFFQY